MSRLGGGGAKNGRCCPRKRLFSAGQIGWRRREKWPVLSKGKVIFCPADRAEEARKMEGGGQGKGYFLPDGIRRDSRKCKNVIFLD
jgi:hypothetical protein